MGTICKVGETKEINGKLYRKAKPPRNTVCASCAFYNMSCPGDASHVPIEDGGCECQGTIWKCVGAPKAPKVAKKHVWEDRILFAELPKKWTKDNLEKALTLAECAINQLGTENAKLKNQIASLKKKGTK